MTLEGTGSGSSEEPERRRTATLAESVTPIGGLIAVSVGVLAVLGIAIGAFVEGTDTAATIAGSTVGVVGSIVGAYFGVKMGTDQSRTAIQAQRQEAAKAQVYAAHLPEDGAAAVVEQAEAAARSSMRRSD